MLCCVALSCLLSYCIEFYSIALVLCSVLLSLCFIVLVLCPIVLSLSSVVFCFDLLKGDWMER